ncbi:helix-turn-helix domain-containing protein [Cognaticolwellia beringensis]|uniref:ParB/Sulfiredoxin domain-containing protein n=1 Tax=Cognaticolwellia beringensis TaxID=1967665 RepID=A0A222G8J0_9GAMM|nr:helix-turn-helix domain-containing protein [Cognaticolwellia beringensis]ASP48215.1 hypothetical protein B5D82_10870 [Cognaticolwellia beringensis]
MTKVLLNTINLQAPTQLRETKESQLHIEDLAYSYIDTGEFTELPWVGRINGGDVLVPIDGFHRLHAVEWLASDEYQALPDAPSVAHLDLTQVEVRITTFATMTEAIIAAAGVNSTHGMKRKNGDIGNAIKAILEVEPMMFMHNPYKLNKDAIMAAVRCSTSHYSRETAQIRRNLEGQRDLDIQRMLEEGKSQRDIAGCTGCTQSTVARISKELQKGADSVEMHHVESDNDESDDGEETPTVFTHMTSVTPVEDPWADAGGSNEPISQMSHLETSSESNDPMVQMTQSDETSGGSNEPMSQMSHLETSSVQKEPMSFSGQSGTSNDQSVQKSPMSKTGQSETSSESKEPMSQMTQSETSNDQTSSNESMAVMGLKSNITDHDLMKFADGLSSSQKRLLLEYLGDF